MRLRAFPIILATLFVTLFPAAREVRADPPFIVALGGVSVEAFFLRDYGKVLTTAYMADALDEGLAYDACFLRLSECEIQEIFWSGDLKDGSIANYTSNTLRVLERIREDFPERDIVIVAHSWGTVVAYNVLHQLQDSGWHQGSVALVVSLGSPLGSQCAAFIRSELARGAPSITERALVGNPNLEKPAIVQRWINFWTDNDKVSGPIVFAENIKKSYRPVGNINCSRSSALLHIFTLLDSHQSYYKLFLESVYTVIEDVILQDLPEECEEVLTSSIPSPVNFGAAYDLLSVDQRLLLKAYCTFAGAVATVGGSNNTQYVYRYGYQWKEGTWHRFEFEGGPLVAEAWYVGEAVAEVTPTLSQDGSRFFVAYVCTWTGEQWKCGCRDETCATAYWQLQGFRRQIEANTETVAGR